MSVGGWAPPWLEEGPWLSAEAQRRPDSSIPLPEPGPSCSLTSCVAWGQCQVEPGHSISRPEDNQGCLSQIKCWQFFRHIYHSIGIEHSVQVKLKFKKRSVAWEKERPRSTLKSMGLAVKALEPLLPREPRQLQLFLPLVSGKPSC